MVGQGVFGTFLAKELGEHATSVVFDTDDNVDMSKIDIVVLAVPANAYREVANKYNNYHIVNVCSIQDSTTVELIESGAKHFTSIHPMFGPRSPREGRTCILTKATENSAQVIELFSKICDKIVTEANGTIITPSLHDLMMSKTQLEVVKISDHILRIVEQARDIPDDCLPTSFKRLREMATQFLDMPPGTKSSIIANQFNAEKN